MYRFSVSASICVVLAASAAVEGTNYVWLEAEPVTAGAIVVEDGEGRALSLECDPALQDGDLECEWLVTIRIDNEEPLWGWALDLASDDENTSITSFSYLTPYFSASGAFVGYIPYELVLSATQGSGADLVRDLAGTSFVSVPDAMSSDDGIAWNVAEFRLSKTVTSLDSGLVSIYGRTGRLEYGTILANHFDAIIGDNAESDIGPALTPYLNALIAIAGPVGESYIPGESSQIIWDEPIDPVDEEEPDDDDGIGGDSGNGNGGSNEGEGQPNGNPNPNNPIAGNGFPNLNPNAGGPAPAASNGQAGGADQGGITITYTIAPPPRPLFDLVGLCGPSSAATIATVMLMIVGMKRRRQLSKRP